VRGSHELGYSGRKSRIPGEEDSSMTQRRPIAEQLRELRAQRGLTLVEASEKTGVGRKTLSNLERGVHTPHMPTLTKIARGYGVPIEELLDGTA
jgi:DNA-binding XRE family transcriptional regulator